MLDKNADTIGVGAFDRWAKIEGRQRLAGDHVGARVGRRLVGRVVGVAVDANAFDWRHDSLVERAPRPLDFEDPGHVHREVVLEAMGLRRADGRPHLFARLRRTGDDAVVVRVNDREEHIVDLIDDRPHTFDRCDHGPYPPVRIRNEQPRRGARVDHLVEISPDPERKQAVALARAVADRRLRFQTQPAQRKLRVQLAQRRSAPESIEHRRCPGRRAVGPGECSRQASRTRAQLVDQLGKHEEQFAPHAVVRRARGTKDETDLPADRALTKVYTPTWRCAVFERGLCPCNAGCEFVFVRRHDREARGPFGGWLTRVEPTQDTLPVVAGEHVNVRRTSRCDNLRCAQSDLRPRALHGVDGDHLGWRRFELDPAKRIEPVHTAQRGGDNLKQPAGRMGVAEVERRRSDSVRRIVEQRVDRLLCSPGVARSLHDEHHRRVRRRGAESKRGCARRVHGLARQVDRADHRRVDFARSQRPICELQSDDTGEFFGGDREARPGEIELMIQSIGDDVRHRPNNARCLEDRRNRVTRRIESFGR